MKKTVSLFQRNYDGDRLVRDEIVPGAEWVAAGEGVATRKIDGTCCMVRDGKLFKRYDAKAGKTPPIGFEPAQPEPDANTGHWPGWLPVGDGPDDARHRDAEMPTDEAQLANAMEMFARMVEKYVRVCRALKQECRDADELLRLLRLDPERYRTEGGYINVPKVKAALANPDDYPMMPNVQDHRPCAGTEDQ